MVLVPSPNPNFLINSSLNLGPNFLLDHRPNHSFFLVPSPRDSLDPALNLSPNFLPVLSPSLSFFQDPNPKLNLSSLQDLSSNSFLKHNLNFLLALNLSSCPNLSLGLDFPYDLSSSFLNNHKLPHNNSDPSLQFPKLPNGLSIWP